MADLASIEDRAELYAAQEQLNLEQALGRGNDGQVWITNRSSAVKVFYREEVFERERLCFRRLMDTNTTRLAGFDVPELINYSYKLLGD